MNVNFTVHYSAAPFIEVLTIQEALDNIGYIDTLRVQPLNITSFDGIYFIHFFWMTVDKHMESLVFFTDLLS